MKRLKAFIIQFREWDERRKFGCEFYDFLIILFAMTIFILLCLFFIPVPISYVVSLILLVLGLLLCHRHPPEY